MTVLPHANRRGQYDFGTDTTGQQYGCAPTFSTGCADLGWPGTRRRAFLDMSAYQLPPQWFGSLIQGQQDRSGLMYMRNRYYDPATGQFTQQDPIGIAGGLNLYGFANGDPVNFSDPFGLCPDEEDPDCDEPERSTGQQVADAIADGIANAVVSSLSLLGAVADAFNPLGDLIRVFAARDPLAGQSLSGGERAAAGALIVIDSLPGGDEVQVGANLRRPLRAAQGADVTVDAVGDFMRAQWSVPGRRGGASRAVWTKFINAQGRTVRLFKDSFDEAGRFEHRKPKFP